jgi:hypothetical protein
LNFFNPFQRRPVPVAWTDSTREATDHYLHQGKLVHRLVIHSNVDGLDEAKVQEHYCALDKVVTGLQGVPVYLGNEYDPATESSASQKKVFQVGENYLRFELGNTNYHPRAIQIDISGERLEEIERILEVFKPLVRDKPVIETTSRVYTLLAGHDGYSIRSIGRTEISLEAGNYTPEAVERYQHLADCLGSAKPCGRFCLFDGPPGTGKSYLIRSLISSLDAVFILIPTAMLGSLSGPDLLPSFLNINSNKKNAQKPIILVLEDADMALVNRQVSRGNPAALAEMLNLADGLVGEMLDLRIVATTNAERIDLDPAIIRPGRMCTHLTLGELSPPQLASIYDRLTKSNQGQELVQKTHTRTLAEVYRLARDATWAPEVGDGGGAGTYL